MKAYRYWWAWLLLAGVCEAIGAEKLFTRHIPDAAFFMAIGVLWVAIALSARRKQKAQRP